MDNPIPPKDEGKTSISAKQPPLLNVNPYTSETDFRSMAEKLIQYYDRRVQEEPAQIWEKGLETAKKWRRMLDAAEMSPDDLIVLVRIAHANRGRGSGWQEMSYEIFWWSRLKGLTTPPAEEFFQSDYMQGMKYRKSSHSDQANFLVSVFERNMDEDSEASHWGSGAALAQEWLNIIQTGSVEQPILRAFARQLSQYHKMYASIPSMVFVIRVKLWLEGIGYPDIANEVI